MEARNRTLKIIGIGVGLLAIAVALLIVGQDYLTLENLREQRSALLEFTEKHYLAAVTLFLAAFASTAFAVPGAVVFSLAGGMLFGALQGACYIVTAATLGGVTAFLMSRYIAGEWFERKYGRQSSWLKNEIRRHGTYYLIFLRIVPIMPFFVVNYLTALTGMRTWTFAWTTALGMLPGALVYANAGRHLARIQSTEDILSWPTMVSLGLLGALSIGPVAWRMVRQRRPGP